MGSLRNDTLFDPVNVFAAIAVLVAVVAIAEWRRARREREVYRRTRRTARNTAVLARQDQERSSRNI